MSGSASVAVAAPGGGGDGYRPPFTAVQWQELEHQALIYKYLMAGVPVPSDLVVPIRRSLEALSARFFNHPNLGYCSYYGKKFDPEPGRCRRTDGKKWRCSKDAYPDSKYCERHMHRGRNRSRKPVESQSASQSQIASATSAGGGNGSYQTVGSGSIQNSNLYPIASSGSFDFRSNVSKSQVDTSPYGINNNNNFRYAQKVTIDPDNQTSSYGVSKSAKNLETECKVDSTWGLMTAQVTTMKSENNSYFQSNSAQLNMINAFEPTLDDSFMSKQKQQYCFFGSDINSPMEVKNEQQLSMRSFFDEWPKTKETWLDLDVDDKSVSTTKLSISTADCSAHDA